MKQFLSYILPCCLALIAAGCDSDDMPDAGGNDDNLVEVTLRAGGNAVSRFDDYNFDNGDNIYVWLIKNNSQLTDQKRFLITNGYFTPQDGNYTKSPKEELTYFAMCGSYTKSGNTIKVTGGSNDVLFSIAQSADTEVTLGFAHAFCKLRLKVTNAARSISSVKLTNVYNQGVFEFDLAEDTFYSCDDRKSSVNMFKDDDEYPYYYYLPAMNYLPNIQAIVTYTNGTSQTFRFNSDFGYADSNELRYLVADMSQSSGGSMGRSSNDNAAADGYLKCVSTVTDYDDYVAIKRKSIN